MSGQDRSWFTGIILSLLLYWVICLNGKDEPVCKFYSTTFRIHLFLETDYFSGIWQKFLKNSSELTVTIWSFSWLIYKKSTTMPHPKPSPAIQGGFQGNSEHYWKWPLFFPSLTSWTPTPATSSSALILPFCSPVNCTPPNPCHKYFSVMPGWLPRLWGPVQHGNLWSFVTKWLGISRGWQHSIKPSDGLCKVGFAIRLHRL